MRDYKDSLIDTVPRVGLGMYSRHSVTLFPRQAGNTAIDGDGELIFILCSQ